MGREIWAVQPACFLLASQGPFKMQELGGREVNHGPVEISTLCVSLLGKGGPCSHKPEIYDFSLGGVLPFTFWHEQ